MSAKPILNLVQREFLADLMKSEIFDDILKGLAEYNRQEILMTTNGAYNMQNVYAAAVNTGTLLTLETLREYFLRFAGSQPASNK